MALPFTLLVMVILVAFVGALQVRVTQTLRFTSYDEAAVRARHLADSGATLAVVLMRDYDADWWLDHNPLSSADLGPAYDERVLGGTFEIRVYERGEIGGTDPYPTAGTYRTIVCTARSNNRTARSIAAVKVTSPLLNFLNITRGNLILGYDLSGTRRLSGSILAIQNEAKGEAGDIQLFHAIQFYDYGPKAFSLQSGTLELAGEMKASGKVFVRNLNNDGAPPWSGGDRWVQDPIQLNGTYPKGSSGLTFAAPDVNVAGLGTWGGAISLIGDLHVEADNQFGARIPTTQEVLDGLEDHQGAVRVDISGHPNGVLLEFAGGKAFLSDVAFKDVGKMYDADLVTHHKSQLLAEEQNQFPNDNLTALKKRLADEIRWDDPMFPNEPYPGGARHLGDGGPPATSGDYFPVRRLVRGARIQTVGLSRSRWTTIIVTTRDTNYVDADTFQAATPLFIRGRVEGKVIVVHDVADRALDPDNTRVETMILGEHEDPSDNIGNKVGPAPGVPGGVTYADRRIKVDPDSTAPTTDDAFFLMSRGQLFAVGQGAFYLQDIYEGNTRINYQQHLKDLDRSMALAYGTDASDPDYNLIARATHMGANVVCTPLYGFAAQEAAWPGLRLTSDGRVVRSYFSGTFPASGSAVYWQDVGPQPAPGYTPGQIAMFPRRFRNALVGDGSVLRISGASHGLNGSPLLVGEARFDYRFQTMDAEDIRKNLGLPLSVLVLSWTRR